MGCVSFGFMAAGRGTGVGLHGVDDELGVVVEEHDDDLEEPTVGVEAEAELACWLVIVDREGDQVLLASGVDVVIADPVFAGRAVDPHLGIVLRN
jgi:hypothetical protein